MLPMLLANWPTVAPVGGERGESEQEGEIAGHLLRNEDRRGDRRILSEENAVFKHR